MVSVGVTCTRAATAPGLARTQLHAIDTKNKPAGCSRCRRGMQGFSSLLQGPDRKKWTPFRPASHPGACSDRQVHCRRPQSSFADTIALFPAHGTPAKRTFISRAACAQASYSPIWRSGEPLRDDGPRCSIAFTTTIAVTIACARAPPPPAPKHTHIPIHTHAHTRTHTFPLLWPCVQLHCVAIIKDHIALNPRLCS